MKTHPILSVRLLAASACMFLSSPMAAQGSVGIGGGGPPGQPIEPIPAITAPWSCGNIYYVSVAGSDSNPGTLASPWRTVTFAVAQARSLTPGGEPITINLLDGTYADGETFPILLPARRIKLQAYGDDAIIRGSGEPDEPVLRVNRAGPSSSPCGASPSTTVRGLTLTDGQYGIHIDAGRIGGAKNTPDRVYVHRCRLISNLTAGVRIDTRVTRHSQHVIEECEIAWNGSGPNQTGDGIFEDDDGTSTTLIRANNIHDNEVGIYVSGDPDSTEPRIVSNFVRDAEWGIALVDCSARVVNNTQGYGRAYNVGFPVYGIAVNGSGYIVLANNILWNPPSYDPMAVSVDDLFVQGSPNFTTATNWILSVVGEANGPEFVAPPTNLHIQDDSPCLDAGTNSFILPILNVNVGPITARADCGMDVDGDARVLDFAGDLLPDVEIGADERTDGSGTEVRLSCPQIDANGNLHTGGLPTQVSIDLTGSVGDDAAIFFWVPEDYDPIPFHEFESGVGSWRMPIAGMRPAESGRIGAGGTLSAVLTIPPALGLELEVYFQGVTMTQNGISTVSNRLLLEINE